MPARPVRATWCGMQSWGVFAIGLWTLLDPIPGHPAGSTVSDETLARLGYAPRQEDA